MAPKHFVVTRFGLGIYSEQWFERMAALLLAVTAPSVSRQTSQAFHWLILVDVALTGAPRRALDELAATHPNFHIVTMDVTRMTFMRLGGWDWVWEPCHQYILAHGLVEDPCEYVVTSNIDADDAWACDYIATVNAFMATRLPEILAQEDRRGSHLRHSGGAVLTFNQGLYWFIETDVIEPFPAPFQSMASALLARLSSGLSVLSNRHLGWPKGAEIARFDVHEQTPPHPMWLYVRHGFTMQPWQTDASRGDAALTGAGCGLEETHGVDMAKVRAWRERYPGSDRHTGRSAAELISQLYKITALNRQIAALETRADSDAAGLLARQRAVRDDLVATLREA